MYVWVDEEDATMRASIYTFLLHIHIDKEDWKSALQLLDQAIRDMPHTKHQPSMKSHEDLISLLGQK